MTNPFSVILSPTDYLTLSRRLVGARIILAANAGLSNAAIARDAGITLDTVRKWRHRFQDESLAGLKDRFRSGRPRVFPAVAVAEVKALACALPTEKNVPLSRRWSHAEPAREAISRGIVDTVSAATVRRWLNSDAIKSWQVRSWIFLRDPDFQAKAARGLDLYSRVWDGEPLGLGEYVISDEKSQLQALARRHPDLPPGPGRSRRQGFE